MSKVSLHDLPDDARLWSFGADRALDVDEERELLEEVDAFLESWKAHGAPLRAARDWRYGRFLLVAVDEASVPPSGCSIDALVRVLKGAGERLGVTLVDSGPIWYRADEAVLRVPRAEFRRLADDGLVGPDTTVFDLTVTRLGDVRSGLWERPAVRGWHAKAFFKAGTRS